MFLRAGHLRPLVLLSLPLLAQAQTAAPQPSIVNVQATAMAAVIQGNIPAAAQAIAANATNKGNSPEAQFEIALGLASVAFSFESRRDHAHAVQVGNFVLPTLADVADKLAKTNKRTSAARAYETLGQLHARVFFNDTAAQRAFQQALAENASSPRALAEVNRHAQAEEELKRKPQPGR